MAVISSLRSGGASVETGRPMISSGRNPYMLAAPAFQDSITPSRLFRKIASCEDSTIAARLPSNSCLASSLDSVSGIGRSLPSAIVHVPGRIRLGTVGLPVPLKRVGRCSHHVFFGYRSKNRLKEENPMGKGTEDRAEGTWDKAKGKVKETAGEATGDRDMEREGRMDQAKGAGKRAVGSVKDAAGKVKEDVKDAADKLGEGVGRDDR